MGSTERARGWGTRRDISNTDNFARAYRCRIAIRRVIFFGIGMGGLVAHAEDVERVSCIRARRMDGAMALWWRNYMSYLRPIHGMKVEPELTD